MPEFLQASIQVLLGIGLVFGGGELFVQGSVACLLYTSDAADEV